MLGYTPDISAHVQHEWHKLIWYQDRDRDGGSKIGRWIGVAEGTRGGDCFWILPLSAKPIAQSTVWAISQDEAASNTVQERIRILNESIESKIGDSKDELCVQAVAGDMSQDQDDDIFIDNDDDDQMEITDVDADNYTPETFDAYLTAFGVIALWWRIVKGTGCWTKERCK